MSAGTQCTAYCSLNRFYSCDGVPTGLHGMSLSSQNSPERNINTSLRLDLGGIISCNREYHGRTLTLKFQICFSAYFTHNRKPSIDSPFLVI